MECNFGFKLHNIQYSLDNVSEIYWKKVFISLVKDPNVQFVRVRQDFFALAIISSIFSLI
jgi:hypothetical protein